MTLCTFTDDDTSTQILNECYHSAVMKRIEQQIEKGTNFEFDSPRLKAQLINLISHVASSTDLSLL